MVACTDLTRRAQHVAAGHLGTHQVPQLADELEAAAFAGGAGLGRFMVES